MATLQHVIIYMCMYNYFGTIRYTTDINIIISTGHNINFAKAKQALKNVLKVDSFCLRRFWY